MPRERRILIVTTGLALGGAERQVMLLAKGLRGRDWSVKVVSMLQPLALADELRAAGIPVISLGMRPGVPDPRAVFRLARIVRQWQPQILHSHMVHANLLARVARLLAPVPLLISTAHNISEGPRWREWAYRITDPLCDLTTNVSQAGVDRYASIGATPQSKLLFVPNGIDMERVRPRAAEAAGPFIWLAVGNLRRQKDYPNLLAAWDRVRRHFSAPVLWIAGDGECRAALETIAGKRAFGPSMRLLGVREDVPRLMQLAHGLVMSSSWEGLPMSLLEAALAELPVVATAVGGNAEVVRHRESGLLVPPQDPVALADAMQTVMEFSPETRAEMGRRGGEWVQSHYGIDAVLDRWESLYAQAAIPKASVPYAGSPEYES